ncbi:MAG: hypothetical protein CBC55_02100 [Gammaproteobacteria bacterium TMED95]|nr:MAG: hypothetical protein CBC55_02100 [Gammaproteobacteria bacterium TMED95]
MPLLNHLCTRVIKQYEKENIVSEFVGNLFDSCENDIEKTEALFTKLACKDFSFAVHSLTGWEIIEFGVEGETTHPWYHQACKVPDSDLFFDINGMRTEKDILASFSPPKDNESRYAVDVDPEPAYLCDTKALENLIAYLIGKDSTILSNATGLSVGHGQTEPETVIIDIANISVPAGLESQAPNTVLREMAAEINTNGWPKNNSLGVKDVGDGQYQVHASFSWYAAAKIAGIKTIPCSIY